MGLEGAGYLTCGSSRRADSAEGRIANGLAKVLHGLADGALRVRCALRELDRAPPRALRAGGGETRCQGQTANEGCFSFYVLNFS